MQWKVEYETQDKDINPEWHWIFWIDKIYVKREFTIDVPDTDTLFRVIDALEEWYLELRLRKLERINYTGIGGNIDEILSNPKSWRI
jgi:hypothetical protein